MNQRLIYVAILFSLFYNRVQAQSTYYIFCVKNENDPEYKFNPRSFDSRPDFSIRVRVNGDTLLLTTNQMLSRVKIGPVAHGSIYTSDRNQIYSASPKQRFKSTLLSTLPPTSDSEDYHDDIADLVYDPVSMCLFACYTNVHKFFRFKVGPVLTPLSPIPFPYVSHSIINFLQVTPDGKYIYGRQTFDSLSSAYFAKSVAAGSSTNWGNGGSGTRIGNDTDLVASGTSGFFYSCDGFQYKNDRISEGTLWCEWKIEEKRNLILREKGFQLVLSSKRKKNFEGSYDQILLQKFYIGHHLHLFVEEAGELYAVNETRPSKFDVKHILGFSNFRINSDFDTRLMQFLSVDTKSREIQLVRYSSGTCKVISSVSFPFFESISKSGGEPRILMKLFSSE